MDPEQSTALDRCGWTPRRPGEPYHALRNRGGDLWLVPLGSQRSLQKSLQIFQASTLKGRFLKRFFPLLSVLFEPLGLKYFKTVHLGPRPGWTAWIRRTFGPAPCRFSFILRFSKSIRTIVVQVSRRGGPILGYVKIPCDGPARRLIRHERAVLLSLRRPLRGSIPHVLSYHPPGGSRPAWLGVSSVRTRAFHRAEKFGGAHSGFLARLFKTTAVPMRLVESPFWRALRSRLQERSRIPRRAAGVLARSADRIREAYGPDRHLFGVCHRDFTPGNVAFVRGKPWVYDWEFSRRGYPPHLDYFNFHLFGLGWLRTDGTRELLRKATGLVKPLPRPDPGPSPWILLRCYLVDLFWMTFHERRAASEMKVELGKILDLLEMSPDGP